MPESGPKKSRVGPSVRRYLAESGLDAASLQGTGPHGMLLKGDVLNAMKSGSPQTKSPSAAPAKPPASKSSTLPASSDLGYIDLPTSQIRKVRSHLDCFHNRKIQVSTRGLKSFFIQERRQWSTMFSLPWPSVFSSSLWLTVGFWNMWSISPGISNIWYLSSTFVHFLQIIAQRLLESKMGTPHLYLSAGEWLDKCAHVSCKIVGSSNMLSEERNGWLYVLI